MPTRHSQLSFAFKARTASSLIYGTACSGENIDEKIRNNHIERNGKMAGLNQTPKSERIHIAFFGLRNAGKSTLVNKFTGQNLAIVSDVAGTTTDPVSKAMEILPLGSCLITDTAGLDDVGALGELRVRKTLDVLKTVDIAIWVDAGDGNLDSPWHQTFLEECKQRKVAVLDYRRGDDVADLKKKVAAIHIEDDALGLLEGLLPEKASIVLVCPQDESAPKGRLILPQQQMVRDALERGAWTTVCQPAELADVIECLKKVDLVITDSQAFGEVKKILASFAPRKFRLTSFSILFARRKGDIAVYREGLKAIAALKDGDSVLIAEGCTHHRQCNDIGTVKMPRALQTLSGKKLNFIFSSGTGFPLEENPGIRLVVQCGGCMLSRREVLRRIAQAKSGNVPIVNYGFVLALANGIDIDDLQV